MQAMRPHANPFALMIDPQAVMARVAGSSHLERLERRVCRPLDKPVLGTGAEADEAGAEAAAGANRANADAVADTVADGSTPAAARAGD